MKNVCALAAAAVVCVTAAADGCRLNAQDLRRGTAPIFRSSVDLVTLPVTVTDQRHRYLTDLESGQFQIFENGRPQSVTFFQRTPTPLILSLVLDTSASMSAVLPAVSSAAAALVEDLQPDDVASVVAFSDRIRVLQRFTTDHDALRSAILAAEGGNSTSLYTALYVALKELERADLDVSVTTPRRRVLIVFSDGSDTASLMRFDDVLDAASRANTVVYPVHVDTVSPLNDAAADAMRFLLRRIADETGGRAFFPATSGELRQVYKAIRADLANQYVLAYVSNDLTHPGGFRPVSVHVAAPGAVVRTKRGYFASSR